MDKQELQGKIIETIETVVNYKIRNVSYPSNAVGVVKEEPEGFDCLVKINQDELTCLLPEHLQTWIQKGDVVLVQDLYGDGSRYTVTGKTGTTLGAPSLVFTDEETGKNISGVDGIFDTTTGERLNTTGVIKN